MLAGATMTGKNVTRVDLCAAVYEKVNLSRSECSALVETVLKEITDTLDAGRDREALVVRLLHGAEEGSAHRSQSEDRN